eukprot:288924_1
MMQNVSSELYRVQEILSTIASDMLLHENQQLKQKIVTLEATIIVLTRKESILNDLCKEHKSENDRIKSQLLHDYNQETETLKLKHQKEFNTLQQHIKQQSIQLKCKQKEITKMQNDYDSMIKNHKQNINKLNKQILYRDNKIHRLQEYNNDQRMELDVIYNQLDQTKEEIYNLQQNLCSEKYFNDKNNQHQSVFSTHTRKITGSSVRTMKKSDECLNKLNVQENGSKMMLSPVLSISSDIDDYPEFDDLIVEIENKNAANSETECSIDGGRDKII